MKIKIRDGKKQDLPGVLELIRELARYENAQDEVVVTIEQLEKDGFGNEPLFHFLVAEKGGQLIGLSFYYYRYSTWKGKRLYLEDIVVTEKERGKGVGKELFKDTIQKAKSSGCTGIMWQVLEWNEPAINFYKEHVGAHLDGEWVNCHLMDGREMSEALKKLV